MDGGADWSGRLDGADGVFVFCVVALNNSPAWNATCDALQQRFIVGGNEPARAIRKIQTALDASPMAPRDAAMKPSQRIQADAIAQGVVAEPFVEGAGEKVLVIERHGLRVGCELEV